MTVRRVFYSFHYDEDSSRAAQVRNMGVVEGNPSARDNDWEEVKRGGKRAIRNWIDNQMHGRSCTVVLVGSNTANREWINYEICRSWDNGKGICGIRIHGLKNLNGNVSRKGANPFSYIRIGQKRLSEYVKCYDPMGRDSQERYAWIKQNLSAIIEESLRLRNTK